MTVGHSPPDLILLRHSVSAASLDPAYVSGQSRQPLFHPAHWCVSVSALLYSACHPPPTPALQGADFGRPVGQWFGPNNVAQAIK